MAEIHYQHPTPEELTLVSEEIEAVRRLLIEARHRLFWATRGLPHEHPQHFRSDDPNDRRVDMRGVQERWTEDVRGALTPLIAYLYDAGSTIQGWAKAKRAALPEWEASPDHRVEPGWPPR